MFRGLEERAAGKADPTNPGGGVGATLVYLTSTLAADPVAARLLRYDAANLSPPFAPCCRFCPTL